MYSKLSIIFALILSALQGYSHAVWIKTAPTGKIGQTQTVTVIYSEPDESPEKLNDWYSDVRELELWLTAPDGTKEKLSLKADADRYTSTFTPSQEGQYVISAGKTAKDLGGTTVYQFNATAIVAVGKVQHAVPGVPSVNELVLSADPTAKKKANSPVKLQVYFDGKPASEKMYVSVSAPTGWSKSLTTDEKGVVEFVPIWAGDYALEVSKNWKKEGEHNGKQYTGFWRCATLTLSVAK